MVARRLRAVVYTVPAVVLAFAREQRVLLRPADDHSRNQVGDAHGNFRWRISDFRFEYESLNGRVLVLCLQI